MDRKDAILIRINDRIGQHPFLSESNVSGVYPPLGIAYLAASVAKAGFNVGIIDGHAQGLSLDSLIEKLAGIKPVVAGITTTTFNWPLAVRTARAIREKLPDVKIVVGGPHLSLYPDICISEPAIDAAVVGEGEEAFTELLEAFTGNETPHNIDGVLLKTEGTLIEGEPRAPHPDLDRLPMPAIGLLPLDKYKAITLPRPFVTMITSRGCPFKCSYCSQVYAGGKYRHHSPGRVVAEMERAVGEFKAKEIVFFDESFTADKKRVYEICDRVEKSGIRVGWNIRTRADRMEEDMMPALKKAGCYGLHLGIEAGSGRIQKLMHKNLNLEKVKSLLRSARNSGLETRGYFMIGYPGETPEEIEQTVKFALDADLDWASFTITYPNPGTEIYRDALKQGRYPNDYWEKYAKGEKAEPPGYFTSDVLSESDLEALLKKAYRRFYLRPKFILRKMFSLRLWRTLPGTLSMLMSKQTQFSPHGKDK